jgi:methionyl-tRNA formyltransferase
LKIIFAGTPDFAAAHLKALIESRHEVISVITQPDKPGKRGKKLVPSAVKTIAEQAGLPLRQPGKLRVGDINDLDADVMIVVAYGQILKPDVLAFPRLGCINVHASLLPRWRGAAPVQRAILAGDKETGITLIQMDEGLDTGDMLAKQPVNISADETAASLFSKFSRVGPTLLVETLDLVEQGRAQHEQQDDSLSTYASKLHKDEAEIDWAAACDTIDRQVRAFNPDPVAYTFLGDLRVKVHAGSPQSNVSGTSGQIVSVSAEGILVGCGEGCYLVQRIQLPLGKGSILSGQEVMNGWRDHLYVGARFER